MYRILFLVATFLIGVVCVSSTLEAKAFVRPYIGGKFFVGTGKLDIGTYKEQKAQSAYPLRWGGGAVLGAKFAIPIIAIRTEVEYLYKRSAKTFIDGASQSKVSLGTHGLMLNAYADLDIIPIIKPYISVGAGVGFNELKYVPSSIEFTSQIVEKNSFIWQTGVGFYALLGSVGLDVNVRYLYNDAIEGNYLGRKFSSSPHTFEGLVSVLIFL